MLVPNPSYPIHIYGPVIAGADIHHVPMHAGVDFFDELETAIRDTYPKPKMLIVNFPGNPTAQCVDMGFFERLVAIAREHHIYVVHDRYADLCSMITKRLHSQVRRAQIAASFSRCLKLHMAAGCGDMVAPELVPCVGA